MRKTQRGNRHTGAACVALITAVVILAGCGDSADRADAGDPPRDQSTTESSDPPKGLELCEPADAGRTNVSSPAEVTLGSLTRDPRGPNSQAQLNDEILTLTSGSERALDLSGWTLEDDQGVRFEFPQGSAICRYVVLSIHSGQGTNTDVDFFADWGRRWDRKQGTVRVLDARGSVVVTCDYTADQPALRC